MNALEKREADTFRLWALIWGLGLAGQFCWNVENQWLNTFVYAKIAKDPTIISITVALSALTTCFSTFLFGTYSDRKGSRRAFVALGYILWGILTISIGLTQYITNGSRNTSLIMIAGIAVIATDAILSFFGSMGNDAGFNAWTNDNMNDKNRGQIGAALATQPVIGTVLGTVIGGLLIGKNDNYMLLFCVMGGFVILVGILSLFTMHESETLKPHVEGTYWHQFASVFNFRKFFQMKELVWVNITLAVYFIAFNVYFVHMGNYMIYYLHFSASMMGIIEGISMLVAMLLVIPTTRLINKNKSPYVCISAIIGDMIGLLLLGCFVTPKSVDPSTVLNGPLLAGVFLVGGAYIVILQALIVWSKQLYPRDSKGQFEGIRIIFFVLIPMTIAPLISNPIIKANGSFRNANGLTEYLPTGVLFLAAGGIVILTFIPLFFAKHYHDKRIGSVK